MHHHTIIPYVSLCSGYEGIGLGLHRCIPNLRTVAYCEREAFAIANLVAKMENGLLDSAPVFADVRTFPWNSFTRLMAGGILSFGWPCQPVSVAGQRKAVDDERWLFDIIADGIAIMQPGMLFAENVEGLLTARMPDGSSVFGHCIQRLERLHYRVTAGIFSASEVGAPHQRKRIFILAHRIGAGWEGFTGGMDVCDDESESRGSVGQKGLFVEFGRAVLAETTDANGNHPVSSTYRLNPRWVETLMGIPVGWVMPTGNPYRITSGYATRMIAASTNSDSSETVSYQQQPL
jgi:hypothetical protein